jgi:hypothetical protein
MTDAEQDPNEQFKELLQELRVGLPGVQVLLAFLLVVPFNAGFDKLDEANRWVFFVGVISAALASVLLIAPSAHHRYAWPVGPRGLDLMLRVATVETRVGMAVLGVAVVASLVVVGRLVVGPTVGAGAALAVAGVTIVLWLVIPLLSRRLDPTDRREAPVPTPSRAPSGRAGS